MRSNDRQCFGVQVRHVDGVANCSFKQGGADGLRDLDANTFLRFGGGRAEMRSENKIRRGTKRRVVRQRFGFENIERGGGNMSILQGTGKRGFVNESASRTIDDADAALCFSQPCKI